MAKNPRRTGKYTGKIKFKVRLSKEPGRAIYDDQGPEEEINPYAESGNNNESVDDEGELDESAEDQPDDSENEGNEVGSSDNIDSPAETKDSESDGLSPSELDEAENKPSSDETKTNAESDEASSLDDKVGKGYSEEDSPKLTRLGQKVKGWSTRKKAVVGGGVIGGLVAGLIAGLISIVPLKIVHITSNLEQRFFATSEDAVQKEGDKLLSRYLKKYVIPGLSNDKNCISTRVISKNCVARIDGQGPASRVYNAWKDARLENKLAINYGVEVERRGNEYRLKVNGSDNKIDMDDWNKNPDKDIWQVAGNRNEVRTEIRAAFKGETKWKQTMYRFKVGRLLERKYGIRRCVFFCKSRDNFDDWKNRKREGFRITLIRRVIQPRSELLGLALECMISSGCDSYDSKDEDHTRRDKLQKNIGEYLQKSGREASQESLQQLVGMVDDIASKGGVTKYVIEKLLGKTAAKISAKALPIIGWIDFGADMIKYAKDTGPTLKKWRYAILAAQAVPLYMMYRSHADEIKNGYVDPELVGSMVDSFSDTAGTTDNTDQAAEKSPLYADIMGADVTTPDPVSLFMPAKVSAESNSTPYKCDDGTPADGNKKICPEEDFKTDNAFTDISKAFSVPPLNILGVTADVWNSTFGKLLDVGGEILMKGITAAFPGVQIAMDKINEIGAGMLKTFAEKLFKTPISENPTGARAFSQATAGADVAGNEFAHYGLGARKINGVELAAIRNEQYQQNLEEFKKKSLMARLLDKNESKSLISRVAMATPSNVNGFSHKTFDNIAANPLSVLAINFASVFNSKKAYAEVESDPFSIPQFGFPADDPAFKVDPDTLTDEHCEQSIKEWEDNVTTDELTGTDIHTTSNACLLVKAAATSVGGYYSDDVLEAKDKSSTSSGTGSATAPGTGGPSTFNYAEYVNLSRSELVAKLLASPNWKPQNSRVTSDVTNGIAKDDLVKLLVAIVEKANVVIRPSVIKTGHSDCANSGNTSNHYSGLAIDIGNEEVATALVPWLFTNRDALGLNELIINPVVAGTSNLRDGKPHSFSAAVMGDHKDHIHVSVKGPRTLSPKCGGN